MQALIATAVAKAISAKDASTAREELSAGIYAVDQTIRIVGTINVAEDTEKTPTVSIPLKEVLALFIARAGITREASMALLAGCLRDALADGSKGEGAVAAASAIDEVFTAQTQAMLSSLPKTPVKGSVKAKLNVTIVEDAMASQLA